LQYEKPGQLVEEQMAQSDEVMAQVHSAVGEFEPFAAVCRKVFMLLGALREISFLYEFSSNAFMATLSMFWKPTGVTDIVKKFRLNQPLQFPLVPAMKDGPTLPDSCASQSDLLSWISSLPSTTPPTWVGLAADAEEALDKVMAEEIHDKIKVF
jgi:hypothetical protein